MAGTGAPSSSTAALATGPRTPATAAGPQGPGVAGVAHPPGAAAAAGARPPGAPAAAALAAEDDSATGTKGAILPGAGAYVADPAAAAAYARAAATAIAVGLGMPPPVPSPARPPPSTAAQQGGQCGCLDLPRPTNATPVHQPPRLRTRCRARLCSGSCRRGTDAGPSGCPRLGARARCR